MRVINMPTKASGAAIKCVLTQKNEFLVKTADGWQICAFSASNLQNVADSIAFLVTEARDAGFEQGLQHVRDAIGVSKK